MFIHPPAVPKFYILLSQWLIGITKQEIKSWLNQHRIFPSEIRQGNVPGEAFIMFHSKALAMDA
jgi:hypothetical protein